MEPFVIALAILSLADSISFMIVTPSLAFYITSLGGSQDYYGFVLAIYSFMSFCGKPILGRWSDASNFKAPYMVSISLSVLGGFLYLIAPAFEKQSYALASVALGRIFGGLGRANSALGFAYIARACSSEQRTPITSLLGGVSMVGMAIAPLFSACLTGINFTFLGLPFDNLNSVGLLMVIFNLASQVVVYLFLPDLPKVEENNDSDDEGEKESEWLKMFRCILTNPHIGVPFLTIFIFNFNWQFIEVALAPASSDIFGWGPVQVSYVLGVMALLVFLGMISVNQLSQSGWRDFTLLVYGLIANTIGYLMLYLVWTRGVHYLVFISPVMVGAGSFPFLGAPNRSLFSEAVDLMPELTGLEGTMQALLSMSSSIGGFTAPGMITHYCLRTPDEVSTSNDGRQFTPLALFSPLCSLVVLIGTYLAGEPEKKLVETMDPTPKESPDEKTPLVEKTMARRKTETDADEETAKPCRRRRRTLMEGARAASIRGSMLTPMTIIPPNCKIYDDDSDTI